MSRKNKIKILATAAALSVSGASCSNAENENDGDMEKQSLIEKLKGLAGKGAKAIMPEMAMCYEVPAQPSEEFKCPKCGDVFYLWHNQFDEIQRIINVLREQGHDVSVDRICKRCAGMIDNDEENEVVYIFTYKAPDAKEPHTAYTDNIEDFHVVKAALNGADNYFYFKEIKLSDKADVLKKMLGK